MAFETLILQALKARLSALVLSPVVPIDWPNAPEAFVPPVDADGRPLPYLQANLLWNRNVNRGVSDTSTTEHRGIFQVTVVYPYYSGMVGLTNMAGAVALWFERGSEISVTGCTVKISGKPSLGNDMQDGLTIRLPVSIYFYAFV